jgi:glutathione S-transferase
MSQDTATISGPSIRSNSNFTYTRVDPTLVCTSTGGISEMARWVLDIHEILRIEESYPPTLGARKLQKLSGTDGTENNPVLIQTDSLLYTAESIMAYYDRQVPATQRLFGNEDTQPKIMEWFRRFQNELNMNVWGYVYSELFRSRSETLKLLKQDADFWERMRLTFGFGSVKRALSKQFDINDRPPATFLVEIQKIFTLVENELADGRKYLVGGKLSAADIAFAAISAPIILPEEFGGAHPSFKDISEELRQEIFDLRATPAGQYAMRLYIEDRPINLNLGEITPLPSGFQKLMDRVKIMLAGGQPGLFYFLQKHLPVIKIGLAKIAIVTRHDLVVDVLNRNADFTVKEINAKKMADQKGTFFLGMDKSNPQFDRERDYVRAATKRDDLEIIQTYVRAEAGRVTQEAKSLGKMDVVQTLNYQVLIGLIGHYFGVSAPQLSTMKRWQRTMFYDLFLNLTDNEEKHEAAVQSGKERTVWVRSLISKHSLIIDLRKVHFLLTLNNNEFKSSFSFNRLLLLII